MNRSILPWKRRETSVARAEERDPFYALQRQMNDMFAHFFDGFESGLARREHWLDTPKMDVSEDDKQIIVEADLPGMDEKDVSVTLDNDMLVISGESVSESENDDRHYHISERRYGQYRRTLPIPEELVETDKIKATFKKGVLKVVLPKKEQIAAAATQKTIPISAE